MFNLLVAFANERDPWENGSYSFTKDRVFEYTTETLVQRYRENDLQRIKDLAEHPCLFVSENEKFPSRVGNLTSIDVQSGDVAITFKFNPEFDPLPPGTIESLLQSLGMVQFELSRTHWAIKARDLAAILQSWMTSRPHRTSRAYGGATISGSGTISVSGGDGDKIFVAALLNDKEFESKIKEAVRELAVTPVYFETQRDAALWLNRRSPAIFMADYSIDVNGLPSQSLLAASKKSHPSAYRILLCSALEKDRAVSQANELYSDAVLPKSDDVAHIRLALEEGLAVSRNRKGSEETSEESNKEMNKSAASTAPSEASPAFPAQGPAGYTGEYRGLDKSDDDFTWSHRNTYPVAIADRARRVGSELPDQLQVGVYASHLAQLIAAKGTAMPLSIGLFGAWGSGKSHFMELIQERITALKSSGPAFHELIIQIRFNAWHYLDANLWASLVSEIFDQLFRALGGGPESSKEQLVALKEKLRQNSALAAEANEALALARDECLKAQDALREAQAATASAEKTVLSEALSDLASLLGEDPKLKDMVDNVAEEVGMPALKRSFEDVEQRYQDVLTLRGRSYAVISSLGANWRGFLTLGVIGLAAVSPIFIGAIVSWSYDGVKPLLDATSKLFAQVTTALLAISGFLVWFCKRANGLFDHIESAHRRIQQARAARARTPDVIAAQDELEKSKAAEESAKKHVAAAEAREREISSAIAELAPGRQLVRFLKDRTSGDDYSKHLGLVSIVRKDFKELSDLLAPEEGAIDPSLPRVDRIVLFIDDLDRCRSDRVIEVLEAVHLLLAFPLFAVVVSVDQRWLRQSLLMEYPDLLTGGRRRNGNPLIQAATPQDYLEKIFQVPFKVQPMQATGYRALVNDLFIENPQAKKSNSQADADSNARKPSPPEGRGPSRDVGTIPTGGAPPMTPQQIAGLIGDDSSPGRSESEVPPVTVPSDEDPAVSKEGGVNGSAHPEQMYLTRWEKDDVQVFQPLFSTPRPVKRFANIYALIRVGVEPAQWDSFLGRTHAPGDYRYPLTLIAITAAFPALSQHFLDWLACESARSWTLDETAVSQLAKKHRFTSTKMEWDALREALNRVDFKNWPLPDSERLREWIPLVCRYSF